MNKQNVLNKISHLNAVCEKRGLKNRYKLGHRNGYYCLDPMDDQGQTRETLVAGTLREVGLYLAGMMEVVHYWQ